MNDVNRLYFLTHPGSDVFSGYGLTLYPERINHLVGLYLVDHELRADPSWLTQIEWYGPYQLHPMTKASDQGQGIACQMWIKPDSQPYVQPGAVDDAIAELMVKAISPWLDELPAPKLDVRWDESSQLWRSEFRAPQFSVGSVFATPGVLDALAQNDQEPTEFLIRHEYGDWGHVPPEDAAENDFSVGKDLRILSAYRLKDNTKIWLITEADRSATTLLLPEEY